MTGLEKLYYNPSHYAGYSAAANLVRASKPAFDRRAVVRWLESQDAYTLHRPIRRKFQRLHYNVTNIDDVWEADLIDLRNLKNYNNNYSYLLTIIDVLSKYAWVQPLRDKSANCVIRAFQNVFSRNGGRIPVNLQTDKGKEFVARTVQEFLKNKNIHFRVVRNPDVKAAVIERFNRTLKERMWRYFTYKNTRCYIDILQDLVHAYNHTRHSTTKMVPAAVTLENASIARKNMEQRYAAKNRFWKNRGIKYKAGDYVRVSRAKVAFEKGYEAKWSEEIFKIYRVLTWRKPPVYELCDLADEVIDGIFYEQELVPVNKNLRKEVFIVDRVIKSKGRGPNKQLLVSWQGYPSKFDSWIPATSLHSLQQDERSISHGSSEQ